MRPRIKFCGITRRADLEAAAAAGADAVGVILVAGTPRSLDPARARDLLRSAPPFLARVGVFADEDPIRIRRIREDLGLTAVQLHGSESPGHCAAVGGVRIKTLRVREDFSPASMEPFDVEAFLLEAPVPGALGGGGVAFDWSRLATHGAFGRRIIVAGGLTPDNVAEAVHLLRPYGVDVSSGVEQSPGVKDAKRMEDFVRAVRGASS
ncbi:MAG TPA: phosphoribosylanthranilate isomerase [Candidatus Polarisedimenticolia bacterium]|nr:phosphoribosylanthranilate isomerase [Candidatus Polarisedimenticolia bacterium]